MEQAILQKLAEQDLKLDLIYKSVEKTRKYFLWTLIMSIVVLVLPFVGIALAIPFFINSFRSLPIGM